MSLYQRQEELKLNQNQTVTVVGCGGIGYWVAKILAMSGISKMHLYDPDTLEEHNLNRLDIPYKYIGKNKADVTKVAILNIREEITVYSFPYEFNDMGEKTDWVIDCTDKPKAQLENQELARKIGAKYSRRRKNCGGKSPGGTAAVGGKIVQRAEKGDFKDTRLRHRKCRGACRNN